jgi:hypothetical protein
MNSWASRNEQVQPPAFFVSRAAGIRDRNQYLKTLLSIDPSRCVLFNRVEKGSGTENHLTPDAGGSVTIRQWGEQDIDLQVQARRPGYLVVTQAAYPGWTAWVDGKKVPILRAYDFLIALPLGAGTHTVHLTYREPWVVAGLVIAPLWILGLLVETIRRKQK